MPDKPTRWVTCAKDNCYIAILTLQMEGEVLCHLHQPKDDYVRPQFPQRAEAPRMREG